ncbi:hypothetical protein [Streptomyces sp. ok210]|uniref:hypothetical protein n=1 Tax=Streptomyces sp. ok210 TaxID=1761905 RepID=UPI0008EE6CA6|nr:hypothetical protein [Streptomyces sp. ok210]SFT31822.1 hypothetical protein SAMN04487982_12438 [Streptomyces sp. ok210]
MSRTRNRWLSAAQGADWFQLNRHDDPDPTDPAPADPAEPAADPGTDPEAEPEGADKLGDAGKKALDAMKAQRAEAKKAAAAEKKRADELARKVAEFEDRDKSDLDKATEKAERAAEAASKATARAVRAEVKAAAADFADPEDAAAFLDLSAYTSDDGEIDTEAISADLEALLERKPHLRRPAAEPEKKKQPKPDPGQGARPTDQPTDFRTASREDLEAELASSVPGFRLRS